MVTIWQLGRSSGPMMIGTSCSRNVASAVPKSSASSATEAPSGEGSHCGEEPMPSVPEPMIERVKFLSIFSSNLDEFFEIRVAGIKQQIESVESDAGPDEMSPTELFNAIQKTAHELVNIQYTLWNSEIVPQLAKNNIHV